MTTKHPRMKDWRDKKRAKGAVVVYALISDPQAIEAFEKLREIYGSHRAVIEAAMIEHWEELQDG